MGSDSHIALDGSSDLVVGFFECSLNSILYQRGIYPPEDFQQKKRYGISVLMSINEELNAYLDDIIQQLKAWLQTNKISKLVLVIKSKDTNETLERWQFDVNVNKSTHGVDDTSSQNDSKNTTQEIRSIMRQIVASVSFLPTLDDDCTFNVLVYASEDVEVPITWTDSDANLIPGGGEHIRLRSFSTAVHKVDAVVAYRVEDSI
ncbi:mitotic spindle checkpoint protein [Halteromyces radiatus]|uniref:mitotic spindle checkpoint protein n=1 Tax=Halteromyces radiatus TaxID=101107 RepID=UPI00221EA4F5|nr:mitotic spindle checkpoint protein [Halteromyces radiatus]KAI8088691.1 mitotic spindle checkpoint protein [Halteromyces radiatus]